MQLFKSLRRLARKINVTQKLMLSNTELLRKDLGDLETCLMNAIFQRLAEVASSLRSNPKQLVTKEGRNLQEQVLALLKLVHNAEGKVIHPLQVRHAVKVELPHFADNTQQDAHEFLMTILPVLQLSRYQGSLSSLLQCKSCKYQSIKKEIFSCIEVWVPEREV